MRACLACINKQYASVVLCLAFVQDKMHVLQAHLASNKEAALRVASLLARFMQIADVAGTSARRLPASWNPGNSVVWH